MNDKRYPRLRPFDIPLIAAALLFCIFLFWRASATNDGRRLVEIKTEKQTWLFALDRDFEFQAQGPLGFTTVLIADGTVHVHDSPCPEKLCLQSGKINKTGQWIACLPNKVFITIKGGETNDVDAYSF